MSEQLTKAQQKVESNKLYLASSLKDDSGLRDLISAMLDAAYLGGKIDGIDAARNRSHARHN